MENAYQIRQLLLHLQNILQVFHTLRLCHLCSLIKRIVQQYLAISLSLKLRLCVTVSATARLRYNLHCVVLDQKALSLKLILIFKPQCVQKFIKTNLSHLQCEVHAQRS